MIHGDSAARNRFLVYSRYNPFTKRIYLHRDDDDSDDISTSTDIEYHNDEDLYQEEEDYYANVSSTIYGTAEWLNWQHRTSGIVSHPTIRAYKTLVQGNYIKPEIGVVEMLPTGETVVVLNTFWLRIFQRKCRKYIADKERLKYNNYYTFAHLKRRLFNCCIYNKF